MSGDVFDLYPPGSPAARDAGCRCPVMDNRHGRGAYTDDDGKPQFWTSEACNLHWSAARPTSPEPDRHE